MAVDVLRTPARGRLTVLVPLLVASARFFSVGAQPAVAGSSSVGLGTADAFAVLAGSEITNTNSPTTINGDLGLHPGTSVTNFPPGTVNGDQHVDNAVAEQAKTDLVTAYNDAAGRSRDATVSADLGGQTLTPGVYGSNSSLGLTGTLTLDAQGDANAVFIFQAGSTLTTASASQVNLIGGAQACNVFWQIGSSATLGTNSTFVGNILALQSITLNTGATVDGRTLARNGAVTFDDNTVTRATCAPGTGEGTDPDDGDGTNGDGDGTNGDGDGTDGGDGTGGDGDGGQVDRIPTGGVDTGGGSTAGSRDLAPLAVGVGLLAVAAGAWMVRRRVTQAI